MVVTIKHVVSVFIIALIGLLISSLLIGLLVPGFQFGQVDYIILGVTGTVAVILDELKVI